MKMEMENNCKSWGDVLVAERIVQDRVDFKNHARDVWKVDCEKDSTAFRIGINFKQRVSPWNPWKVSEKV